MLLVSPHSIPGWCITVRTFASPDMMRFLGRNIQTTSGRVTSLFSGEVISDLNPWSEKDAALPATISRGEYAINGMRNRDLRRQLWARVGTRKEQRRRGGAVSRQLRLLRAHGLLRKVSGTHRYALTQGGRKIITVLNPSSPSMRSSPSRRSPRLPGNRKKQEPWTRSPIYDMCYRVCNVRFYQTIGRSYRTAP
jgi:hypothetical protein